MDTNNISKTNRYKRKYVGAFCKCAAAGPTMCLNLWLSSPHKPKVFITSSPSKIDSIAHCNS